MDRDYIRIGYDDNVLIELTGVRAVAASIVIAGVIVGVSSCAWMWSGLRLGLEVFDN